VCVTPVERAAHVSRVLGREVFVKRDDLTHPRYGGNKVRKLAWLLAAAHAHDATDLVTTGAVGSHHVLATAVHGREAGLVVHAVVVPQPYSPHAEATARASLAQGARLVPARGAWEVPARLAAEIARLRAVGRRPYMIPVGGSSPRGAAGYIEAMGELAGQVTRGEAPPWPDVMVCALGSGGTHAGLLAGARAYGAPSRVVGVRVTAPWMLPRVSVAWLAGRALDRIHPVGSARERNHVCLTARDVQVVTDQLGAGYGHPTDAAREAQALFAQDGLTLDLTYTAKAAAGLVAMARRDPVSRTYLFWHTLSSAPMEPLVAVAPIALPPAIRALWR
jgi:1-aminocyclopropane-1-carboxylate deaminase/D-cysteine desulfhydrase-like pyridoxal-dependent ACC family enzyme